MVDLSPTADASLPERTPVLAVAGLTKRFPGVLALDDVSLALAAHEIHGLIGQNGAGKSTLINILSGMVRPDSGTINIDGAAVAIRDTRHALSLGVATVYQELSLLPNLSVAENLALGREPKRRGLLDRATMRRDGIAVLDRLGLAIAPDRQVSALPLAERQMVEIAKALAIRPKVLILDEPTAPLGGREVQQLFAAVRSLRADGVAVLYVSHRFAEVLDLCDRATVLRNGRHVTTTTTLSGWSEARLTDTMLGVKSQRFAGKARLAGEALLVAEDLVWGDRVKGVTLAARRGEIIALTGLLGGGQAEVARLIGGDLQARGGSISLKGRRLMLRSPHSAVAAGICLVTDDRKDEGLLPNLPLRENIAIASLAARRNALGFVRREIEVRQVRAVAGEFGIVAASLEVPIRTLSGGNQQKALLARWHLADAEVFVLIEPTRGVDVGARAEIYRRLDGLAGAGKVVIVVSSDLPEVLALADRILVMRAGRIAADISPTSIDEQALNLILQGAERAA